MCVMESVLNFSCELGRQLMQNGGEICRVEESVERVLAAYGCPAPEVFAIPSCVIVNIRTEERNYTKAVRVKPAAVNLNRLRRLNSLCREICAAPPAVAAAEENLREILNSPLYPRWADYLSFGVVAAFFTLFWGGCATDAVAAFFSGLLVRRAVSFLHGVQANGFFRNLIAAMLATVIPVVLQTLNGSVHADKATIGTIMLLVPGLAITNMMRDVLAGDYLAAVSRTAEVLLVALGITIGVAITLTSVPWLFGALGV
ncbi:MAG: threonine/serine exporter family protein [Ruminococcaceae bacterium]|nr:threonine/serine exporter family protein [Oscillospiraceae bacterium]